MVQLCRRLGRIAGCACDRTCGARRTLESAAGVAQRFAAAYPASAPNDLVLVRDREPESAPGPYVERTDGDCPSATWMAALTEGTLGRWFTAGHATPSGRSGRSTAFRLMLSRTPVAGYVGC